MSFASNTSVPPASPAARAPSSDDIVPPPGGVPGGGLPPLVVPPLPATPNATELRETALAAVRKITTISTLPEVTGKIVSLVEDPRSTAAQLHRVIAHDPALITRILKVVNSAFYGLPGQIASIERAIVLLGLNAVKNIAVAASLGQLFRGVKLCDGYTARDLWTHCISVGVAARDLARGIKLPIADEAFLAGMIHDVGLLISLQQNPEKLSAACELARSSGVHFVQAERDLMGIDHQALGMALAELWKFPKSCQVVAGFHHQPSVKGEENRQLLALVYVADTLCCQSTTCGFNLTAARQAIDEHELRDLGVEHDLIIRTAQRLPELLSSASSLL